MNVCILFVSVPCKSLLQKARALFVSVLCTALLIACSNRTELSESVQNLTFQTLDGTAVALNEVEGPTLINFWSTSCVICVKEMPHMAELYTELAPLGFELIAVAMPYDPPNQVLELAQEKQLPFPIALDINGEAVEAFAPVVGTPTSFLLDKEGKLVERYIGALDLSKLRQQVDKLLETS